MTTPTTVKVTFTLTEIPPVDKPPVQPPQPPHRRSYAEGRQAWKDRKAAKKARHHYLWRCFTVGSYYAGTKPDRR